MKKMIRRFEKAMRKTALFIGAVLAATLAQATTIYSNTTTDTLATYFYSTNSLTQLGDQITFDPLITERRVAAAAVQFYNLGATGGTFDATLRFWNIGPTPPTIQPVGTQIGGNFTVTGLTITQDTGPGTGILSVTFPNLGSLVLPNSVVWTVSVSNLVGSLDLGLNFFDPITRGSSDLFGGNRFFIGNNGTNFSHYTTIRSLMYLHLFYFILFYFIFFLDVRCLEIL